MHGSTYVGMDAGKNICLIPSALIREIKRATSDSATVMPPPVKGWRMFRASPSRIAPGVGRGAAGMLLLGVVRMRPLSTAATKGSYISRGVYILLTRCISIDNP